jgi:hypothetical protein
MDAGQFHELMQSGDCVCGHDQSEHLYGDDHQGECSQCGCQGYG